MGSSAFDVIVIGSGPGGYVAAIRAAQLGLKTACIERQKTFGGTCLNVGCIPSKALLQSSEHYAFLNQGISTHGIECEKVSLNFQQMMERKATVVKSLVDGVKGLLKRNQVTTIFGSASMISEHEVAVEDKTYTGKNIILATGSTATELPFLKYDEKTVLSSTGALSIENIPKKLLVIGAGVIGVELASVYQRLGAEVTLIEMLDQITVPMDKAIAKMLLKLLQKQGMTFHLGAKVEKAEVTKTGVTLAVSTKEGQQTFEGDKVLVAIGRAPYTEGLGLDKIGVKMTKRGFVAVDHNLRTNFAHIYAIGDIVEGPMLAHRASEEGVVAAELIAGMGPHINYLAIPNVVYTHPEVAAIGFTDEEAKGFGLDIFTGTCLFKGNPRARCAGDTEGMVKIIGEKKSGKLVGMHIIGPNASEMIGEGVLAIEKGATVEELAYASHAHPTLTETIKEAALAALGRAIHI